MEEEDVYASGSEGETAIDAAGSSRGAHIARPSRKKCLRMKGATDGVEMTEE